MNFLFEENHKPFTKSEMPHDTDLALVDPQKDFLYVTETLCSD